MVAAPAARAARDRTPSPAPADAVIDGPGGIVALTGLSIARDGTGGLVYLKDVAGVPHVFVSALLGGGFQAPVQVDGGLAGPSSQPVIAAGNGGVLLVAFINGGELYVCQTTSSGTALSVPAALYAPAANPTLSMSNFGKAYLAFTDPDGAGGGDVRAAYWYQGGWALASEPLDADAADAAGTGSGRPAVAAAGDGIGIVAWGEDGHIYTRRLSGATPSVVDEQADPSTFDGWQEVSAADPTIATGGDSTFATVAFTELLSSGAAEQQRVLDNRLHGSQYDGTKAADGAADGGPEGADDPQAAVTEYGRGFVTSELQSSHALFAAGLGTSEAFASVGRVDSLPNASAPYAAPATAGLVSTLIAWQQSPGSTGPAEIRVRYAPDGVDLGPEQVLSNPAYGAADAALGLQAAGDVAGDAAVAWVQGQGAGSWVVASQLFQAPGGFAPAHGFAYSRSATPALAWSAANELWGSPQYDLYIDGAQAGETTGLRFRPSVPLPDGRHQYQVTAVNRAGLSTSTRAATVLVDTTAPQVSFRLRGRRLIKLPERISVSYRDRPPAGLPPSAASGVGRVYVHWGDGTVVRARRTGATHVYARRRRYTITVVAIDRAGNRTVVHRRIVIRAPRRHRRGRHHRRAHSVRHDRLRPRAHRSHG